MLQQLIQVRVAVEAAVPLEEVVLYVAHHPLGLAFGSGALRATGFGNEPIMIGQLQEAGIEGDLAITVMTNHRRLLVIHQNTGGDAIKVPEGLHQGLVGVFRILAWAGPDVKVSGVAQHVHRDVGVVCGRGRNDTRRVASIAEIQLKRMPSVVIFFRHPNGIGHRT